MSPSIYLGCVVGDEIGQALQEVNKTFKEIENEGEAAIATLETELEKVSGTTKAFAEATLGSVSENQILWKAKEAGRGGNEIKISYIYEGPTYANDVLTGTITVVNGVSNIAGVGTLFTTEVQVGDAISIEDSSFVQRSYVVTGITSDVALSLDSNYGGATEAGLDGYVTIRARKPFVYVTGKYIVLSLAVDATGNIDPNYDMATTLADWLTYTALTDLVGATHIGSGTSLPEIVDVTPLIGGHGTPLKDAEEASDTIAKQFGHTTYQSLMKSIAIPVIETEADAAAYLESVDDEIVIVNKKLFIVEGTNLVGIRQLYNLMQQDLVETNKLLTKMEENSAIPYLILTENEVFTSYQNICNEAVEVATIKEFIRSYNEALQKTADTYANGDISQLNGYIFWVEEAKETIQSYTKLDLWGYEDILITDIIEGTTPSGEGYSGIAQIPTVRVIEDPKLFEKFSLTNAEIEELLQKDVLGIRAPSVTDPEDKKNKLATMLRNDQELLENGMRSKVKKPLAAAQAIDMSKTGGDDDLAKEMATRGRGCARQLKNMSNVIPDVGSDAPKFTSPNVPSLDIPNIPSADLPNAAKGVESAFGAISSVVSKATSVFDKLIGGMMKAVKGTLNKLQNIMSMAENLINNDLTQCLLGAASAATGGLDIPSLGATPSISGGIPSPMALLGDALKEMSAALDETITAAFESMMAIIEKPLCMVMAMIDDILGFDLGAELNPCKDAIDPDSNCPPAAVQSIINSSEELSGVFDKLKQASLYPVESSVQEVTESVEDFTGDVKKQVEEVTQEITRGIKEVMEDITQSIESKVDVVNEFDMAIKKLLGEDTAEMAANVSESLVATESCAPVSMGALTDAITAFI